MFAAGAMPRKISPEIMESAGTCASVADVKETGPGMGVREKMSPSKSTGEMAGSCIHNSCAEAVLSNKTAMQNEDMTQTKALIKEL